MNCSEDCDEFHDLDSRNHSVSLPRDESIIICHFNICIESSCYLSISYDKLAVIALLPFYKVLYAVVIKIHAVTKMGTKWKRILRILFFLEEMLETFLSGLKIIFVI